MPFVQQVRQPLHLDQKDLVALAETHVAGNASGGGV